MIVKLSEAGIKDAINKIDTLKDNIKVANQMIVAELVREGCETAAIHNVNALHSSTEIPVVIGKTTQNGSKGYVALKGDAAVYDEFGTGEMGLDSPHPLKSNFGLNPYNSGPIVSVTINEKTGRHYWFYRGYTEGIPAGKQMYKTANELRKVKNDIVTKEMNSALQRFR